MSWKKSLVPALCMCVATVAFPCGGSEVYFVDGPLVPARYMGGRALSPMADVENVQRDEVRFLPGLLRADSVKFAPLIGRSPMRLAWYDTVTKPRVVGPSDAALHAAWARGDIDAAKREAASIVARIMSMPADMDSSRDVALMRAVETIELAPIVAREPVAMRGAAFTRLATPFRTLALDSLPVLAQRDPTAPRRASFEYAALRIAMRDQIPNASREELRTQMTPSQWNALHAQYNDWLQKYPTHPYAGLVKFSRLRLFYLASQTDSAWATAAALYDVYPARAAAEMRYLLVTGMLPPQSFLLETSIPIELRASLVGNLTPSRAAWSALMAQSLRQPTAPWAENLQERLLASIAVADSTVTALPESFPAWRATASPMWRYMWALSMVRVRRANDAAAFARVPLTAKQDSLLAPEAALLSARIHMLRGAWSAAVSVPTLDEWTRRYILRVLAPDSVATALVASANRNVARDARLVVATRAAHQGKWDDAAAAVRSVDAARAARYARIGVLARDTVSNAGLLRFARAAGALHGQLFYESTRLFYRGMVSRDYELSDGRPAEAWELPWSRADERRRMYAYLRSSAERYVALRAYASYLGRPGVSAAERRVSVREADRMYLGLIGTDPSRTNEGYWRDSLPGSAEARVLRRAGRGS